MKGKLQLKEDKTIAWLLLGYAIVLLLFCSGLSPIFGFNGWADVNIYFNIGKSMFDGQVLYKDIFDHKGPFVFLLYGFGTLFSKTSFIGIFLIEIIFLFISLWFVYKIGCLYLKRFYAFFCTLIYPIFLFLYNGSGGSAEELSLPFLLISFYFLLKSLKGDQPHDPFWMLIHGIMVSFVFLIKLNIILFWSFVPVLFIIFLLRREYHLIIRNLITLLLGIFLVAFPTLLYFYFTDSLYDFYHAYIDFNRLYGAPIALNSDFAIGLAVGFYKLIITDYILMIPILLGLIVTVFTDKIAEKWTSRFVLLVGFIALYCAISVSPAVFEYYYIPLTIFDILGVVLICSYLFERLRTPKFSLVYSLGVVAMLLIIGLNYQNKRESLRISSQTDFIDMFSEEILKQPKHNRTLLCLGLNDGISVFTRANIMPTVKYFFTPNIGKEVYPAISEAQRMYIENKALSFVIVRDEYRDYSTIFPYLEANYDLKKTYLMDDGQVYYLYKRKS